MAWASISCAHRREHGLGCGFWTDGDFMCGPANLSGICAEGSKLGGSEEVEHRLRISSRSGAVRTLVLGDGDRFVVGVPAEATHRDAHVDGQHLAS